MKVMPKSKYFNDERAAEAQAHIQKMSKKYSEDILEIVYASTIYMEPLDNKVNKATTNIIVDNIDSVSAIYKHGSWKTAVLNFASFYNPGGGFAWGTMAQEEALCSESVLYNVLSNNKFKSYYANNGKEVFDYKFADRGIYSPSVIFERPFWSNLRGANVKVINTCDVITVAAPNRRRQTKTSAEENYNALAKRIDFILSIAQEQKVKTLILGAFGCGVFAQKPEEVATLFKEALKHYHFDKVVFAIMPDKENTNFKVFSEILNG